MIRTNIISVRQEFAIVPSTFSIEELASSNIYVIDEETKRQYVYGPVVNAVWDVVQFNWDEEARDWDFEQTEVDQGWFYTLSDSGNYVIITLLSTIGLREGARYSIEIRNAFDLIYKDVMFITGQDKNVGVFEYTNNFVPLGGTGGYTVI